MRDGSSIPSGANTTAIPSQQPVIEVGQCLYGFRVSRVTPISELRLTAYECEHVRSGARLLHLSAAEDRENLLSIAFRTPPPDATGLPHILEHCVLGGSRKFPVKDPFVEMLKRSMATFINAMTYPDKTVYPVASTVRDDFFNLADVYLDAVFHSLISPQTFRQEGFHFAFGCPGDTESPLVGQGIVYSEMKGEYCDPDSIIDRESKQRLFPGSPYGHDSGGDPDHIHELSYDAFRDFYRRLYHPSNAYIVAYGDISTADQLAFLQPRLDECVPRTDCRWTAIENAPLWPGPRRSVCHYALESNESPVGRAAVTVNWAVGPGPDAMFDLTMEVVDHLLLGNAGSPLRKALVDSHLGGDLADSGYQSGTLVGTFHAGVRDTDPEKSQVIETLILDTLRQAALDGFSPGQVETAFQQLRYACREVQNDYPMRLMSWVYDSWLYDRDPLAFLFTGRYLARLHDEYRRDPECFQRAIRERLLDNPHRMTVTFIPKPGLQHEHEAAEEERLRHRRDALSAKEIAEISAESEELTHLQATPNSPEALACLPSLRLPQVPAQPIAIPSSVLRTSHEGELLVNDVFANGISYVSLALDLCALPAELWPYVPLFAQLFVRLGAGDWDYIELSERAAASTGGIRAVPCVGTDAWSPDHGLAQLCIDAKSLDATVPDMLCIVREVIQSMRVDNLARLHDVLQQTKVRLHGEILADGHRYATSRAGRSISLVSAIEDLWSGIPQVWMIDRLVANFARDGAALAAKLEAIRRYLADSAPRIVASFTGPSQHIDHVAAWLAAFGARPGAGTDGVLPDFRPQGKRLCEGLAIPSEVGYCGCCLPAPHFSDPASVPLQVFAQLLSFDYLWERIRVQSGAYGAFALYNSTGSAFQMSSFRDPDIEGTIDVFDGVTQYISETTWTGEEVERAAISSAKDDEKPIRPGRATSTALWRHLSGVTEELRRQRRHDLLHITPEAVAEAAQAAIVAGMAASNVCILADRDTLGAARPRLGASLVVEDVVKQA